MKIPVIIILLLGFHEVFAQAGSILGKVTDEDNRPLAGVSIVLDNKRGAVSDAEGNFRIDGVQFGAHSVKASLVGYRDTIISSISINSQQLMLSFVLNEKPVVSEQVVVSASKYAQSIMELPVSASVIDAREIAWRNASSMDYVMRYVPGVSMNLDQISIRGSSGYSRGAGTRVLVAIDGVPLYSGDTGEIMWEMIPSTEIDHIEVIKGAASSLYGSSAIGGVVNVITRSIPESPFTYIKGTYGVYGHPSYPEWDWSGKLRPFNRLTLTHSQTIGKTGFTLSLTRNENSGYRRDDYYKRFTGYLKAVYNINEKSSLSLSANSINQTRGNFIYWKDSRNVLIPREADQGQKVISSRYLISAAYNNEISSGFSIKAITGFYKTDWLDEPFSNDKSASGIFHSELQAVYNAAEGLTLISGIETDFGNVTSNLFGDHSSVAAGYFIQGDYRFSFPLTLTAGGRFDFNERKGLASESSFSPKAGLNYLLSDETSLRASFGTGFRAPTLAETYTSTTAAGIRIKPNPLLTAESNWTAEAGIRHSFGTSINIDAAIFQNEYFDFIEPGIDPKDGLVYFGNITRARIQGAEAGISYSVIPGMLTLKTDYTYLWARDIEKNEPLKYRPRHTLYADLNFNISPFEAGVSFRTWSRIEKLDQELVDLGVVRDGDKRVAVYTVDIRAGYNLTGFGIPGKLMLNVENLFNYNYIEIIGNLSPIRNYSFTLEAAF